MVFTAAEIWMSRGGFSLDIAKLNIGDGEYCLFKIEYSNPQACGLKSSWSFDLFGIGGYQRMKKDRAWIKAIMADRAVWNDEKLRCDRCDDWDFPPRWEGTDE